jgi:carboxymethylenebutenolidase
MKRVTALIVLALGVSSISQALAGEPARTTLKVGMGKNIDAVLFTPDGAGPFPGIMLLPTAFGMGPSDESYCRKLAQAGYVCLVHDFIRAHGIGGQDMRDPVFKNLPEIYKDLNHIEEEMGAFAKVRPGGVGAIGFSAGGFFAIGLASRHRTLASVAYYPALGPSGHTPRELRLEHSFSATSAPLLILHGTVDHIPVAAIENLDKALTEAGAPHEVKIYQYAGHDFERDFSQPGNQAAAADAWPRTLDFFKRYLQ